MQYTLRKVPPEVDRAIRDRARQENKSLNEAAVEALTEGLGLGNEALARRDLSDILGTWKKDPSFDEAIEAQDQIDESLWK